MASPKRGPPESQSAERAPFLYSGTTRFLASLAQVPLVVLPLYALLFLTLYTLVYILRLLPWTLRVAVVTAAAAAAARYVLRAVRRALTPVKADEPAKPSGKLVAVIGGGISGLITAKEMIEEGHSVVVYEKGPCAGGVWSSQANKTADDPGRVWDSTVSSSSAMNTGISDFPLRSSYPENVEPNHVTAKEFEQYIIRYMAHWNLDKHVKLRHALTAASFDYNSDKWILRVEDLQSGSEFIEKVDYLAVCTGQAQVPRLPSFPGTSKFTGEIMHISSLTNNTQAFENKNVVAVGSGETASDVVAEVANHSSSLSLSIRNPLVVLPRNFFGSAPDAYENRALYVVPAWFRWFALKSQWMALGSNKYWTRYDTKTRRPLSTPSAMLFWSLLFTKKYFTEWFSNLRTSCSSVLVTKTENFLYAVESGKCQIRPGIHHLEGDEVIFDDGTRSKCDVLLLLTGYREVHPYFDVDEWRTQTNRGRYLLTFHPSIPNAAFIGYGRGHVGSIILPSEMQARWFALIVSGKRSLPNRKSMELDIADYQQNNRCYASTLGGWFLTNYIARHHVKCEPCPVEILVRHGFKILFRVYSRSFASYMYRFVGPHAKPDVAVAAYEAAELGKIHIWTLVEIASLMFGPIFYVLSSVPIIGDSFLVRPLMSLWW